MIKKLLTIVSIFFATYCYSVTCESIRSGNWNTPSTWDCGRVPNDGDIAIISAGHIVTVDCNCGAYSNFKVEIYGIIDFNNGRKISMDDAGEVQIYNGGKITGGNGGSKVIINSTVKWNGNDGDIIGPCFFDDASNGCERGILPIELIGFDAMITDEKTIRLRWSTAQEVNNDFFTIERSSSGVNFEEISEIPGAGNSIEELNYETYDNEPLEGISYYRLKQTDYDGKFVYFNIIGVSFEINDKEECILKVFPNPCIGRCTITMSECIHNTLSTVKVQVLDASGHIISSEIPYTQADGSFTYSLNTSNNFAPGVYIIKGGGTNTKSQKIIIK